jgi:catechol 2,3-dioxygenase-like lactoylglutathione lyase family enzyme
VNPHITLLTLGVDDLERAVVFYRDGLGLTTKGIIGKEFENGAVAFFNLQSGMKLALWPRKSLSADTGLPVQAPSATELSIGHNVSSREEVDAVMLQAKRAGGDDRQTRAADVLWRLRGLLPGSGRPLVGSRIQPGVRRAGLNQGFARIRP